MQASPAVRCWSSSFYRAFRRSRQLPIIALLYTSLQSLQRGLQITMLCETLLSFSCSLRQEIVLVIAEDTEKLVMTGKQLSFVSIPGHGSQGTKNHSIYELSRWCRASHQRSYVLRAPILMRVLRQHAACHISDFSGRLC